MVNIINSNRDLIEKCVLSAIEHVGKLPTFTQSGQLLD